LPIARILIIGTLSKAAGIPIAFAAGQETLLRKTGNRADTLHTVARLIRNDVLGLVDGQEFLLGLRNTWAATTDPTRKTLGELLLSELALFCRRSRSRGPKETTATEEKARIQRLGRASMVAGSVTGIIDDLPPLVKGGLTIPGELLYLFKGNRSIGIGVD